jgi:benzoyl-CoA 2,3-dioxygenase component B
MARICTFDDWVDYFRQWQKDLQIDPSVFGDYQFATKFGQPPSLEIEFGDYKGRRGWDTALQIPDQRVRDGLLHLIVYQGDTEFASTEQQRKLLQNPPSPFDLQCAARVMREEMRHGWQMAHLLIKYFGRSGKIEAQKLLERRAFEGTRLLGAFNQEVRDWVDFYCYTALIDRDGKYQLTMLSHSGFKPLASSVTAMLQEESFHLWTGYTGLSRILKAGKVPVSILQRHVNKWFSCALDLFGVDHSTSAHWFYVWGLKGRFDEGKSGRVADPEELNEMARQQYRSEVGNVINALNKLVPAGQPYLTLPDHRFNRRVGDYAGKPYSVTGELLPREAYERHVDEVLPGEGDKAQLREIYREADWIFPVS